MSDTGQICCHIGNKAENHAEICSPCETLTLFGWLVPEWLQLVGAVGFFTVWAGLGVYIVGYSRLWWGPDDDVLIKWRRKR